MAILVILFDWEFPKSHKMTWAMSYVRDMP